jgi:hypothetical protein
MAQASSDGSPVQKHKRSKKGEQKGAAESAET